MSRSKNTVTASFVTKAGVWCGTEVYFIWELHPQYNIR